MSKRVTFQLDTKGAEPLLQQMSASMIYRSGNAVAMRAMGLVDGSVGIDTEIRKNEGNLARGKRAIATVSVTGSSKDIDLLRKSLDAGKV